MFSIYADGQLVCSSEVLNEDMYAIDSAASVVCELDNKAGSFNFTMYPTHYLYDKLRNYTTEVDVWLDNECIFTGRVMNSTVSLTERNVYCEGALSYFNDSIQPKFEKKTITPRERFNEIIEEHNKQVDIFKRFSVGTVDIKDADIEDDFELTGATNTFSTLSSDLLDRFGGYLRVYRSDNLLRIDWVTNYNHICAQPISFGENLISYSENDGIDDAWSILYPTASGDEDIEYSIASVNNDNPYYELPERIAKFGRIIKTIDFDDIESDQELLDETLKWLEKNDTLPDPTITISAVDLSVLFPDAQKFFIGDTISFKIWSDKDYRVLTCSKITYSIFKPGQVEITLGKPPRSLTDAYFSDREDTNSRIDNVQYDVDTNKDETNRLTERVGQAERDIVVNANSITANAENIAINAARIEAAIKELTLKASDSDLVWLQKTTEGWMTKTDQAVEGLQSTQERLATRLGSIEVDINGGEGKLGLNAQYAQLFGNLTDLEGDQEAIRKQLNEVGEYVNEVGIEVNAQKGELALKASQTTVDAVTRRLSKAEADIVVNYNNIGLKVSKDDIVNAINLSTEGLLISANKIDLQGYVTASELAAEVADIKKLLANLSVSGNAVVTGSLNVEGGTTLKGTTVINNLIVGTQRATWHSATFVTKVGVTFNRDQYSFLTSAQLNAAKDGIITSKWTGNVVTSVAVNPESQTIQYLGLAD